MKFIRKHTEHNRKDPYRYFYLLYKVHKSRKLGTQVPTRPVCPDCASVTNPINKWVDVKLQPVSQSMEIYFKDSFEFKILAQGYASLCPTAWLFTFDTVSMYTNIPTDYVCFGNH